MSERLRNKLERIELSKLKAGDVLHMVTGDENRPKFTYEFAVSEAGRWPVGQIKEMDLIGTITAEARFELQGAGLWTTRAQNPVQDQNLAFTSEFSDVYIGGYIVGGDPDNRGDRITLLEPIMQLELTKNQQSRTLH